ncbi:plasmid replication initiation protein [Oenococcus oeni]|nr:plasmid replication initiation protein [Limosilactobacillus fermentum]OIL84066.1 plasmid replication initiation protein [Oenococcus oeni]MCT3453148.1 plasmid replication initiation protein [Limosilactobacillus fermentum]MCT3458110.1 plasmid replication initiation protein [Limosilactobacillus fermentum]OIL91540.1 plasmid replication initiation protein [Oenococcus oeni]
MCWNQEREFLIMKKQKKETPNEHFEFYEKDNVYGALFFQFPKVLLYGEKYKRLSSDAKLAYMVLKDRLEYSLRNNWIDEDNHVYFIFTNQELVNLFNCSEHKVIKVKTELESLGLLFQKQMGFNPKTKKNEPNRLYLSKLDVEATDVYLREKSQDSSLTPATSGTEKSAVPRKNAETPATSGTEKSAVPHKSVENNGQSIATSGTEKSAVNIDKELGSLDTSLDTFKDTEKPDFSSSNYSSAQRQKQNEDLIKNAPEYLVEQGQGAEVPLEADTIRLLSLWVNTPKQMHDYIGIIFNAKKYAQEEIERQLGKPVTIILDEEEELQHDITTALRRAFNSLRKKFDKHEKVNSVEDYLFITMVNTFQYWYNSVASQRQNVE